MAFLFSVFCRYNIGIMIFFKQQLINGLFLCWLSVHNHHSRHAILTVVGRTIGQWVERGRGMFDLSSEGGKGGGD